MSDPSSSELELLLAQAEMLQQMARETEDSEESRRLQDLACEFVRAAQRVGELAVPAEGASDAEALPPEKN
jgi:hypothetical protein